MDGLRSLMHIEMVNLEPLIWVRPPQVWSKVNVDTSCYVRLLRTGLGVLIRDDSGNVTAAMTNVCQVP